MTNNHNYLNAIYSGVIFFSILFGGSMHLIGPVSARMLAFLVLLIQSICTKGVRGKLDNNMRLFCIWTAVYVLVNLIQGYVFEESFYKDLISSFAVSIGLIYMLPKLIKTKEQLNVIIFWIVVFYIFNALVTCGQFVNNTFCWSIAQFISPISDETAQLYDASFSSDLPLSVSLCPGISGFVVNNGYIIACLLPVVTVSFWNKSRVSYFVSILILITSFYAAFCTQQRMCSLIVVCYFLLMEFFRSRKRAIIIILCLFVGLLFLYDFIASIDLEVFGRLFMNQESGRGNIYNDLLVFFNNPRYVLLGHNIMKTAQDEAFATSMGHICFLDAWIRGGILLFLLFLPLFFSILKTSLRIVRESYAISDFTTMTLGGAVVLNLFYSFTHSAGITSGSVLVFGSYVLMKISYSLKSRMYDNKRL